MRYSPLFYTIICTLMLAVGPSTAQTTAETASQIQEEQADPLVGRGMSSTEPDGTSASDTALEAAIDEAENSVEQATQDAVENVLSAEEAAAVEAATAPDEAPLDAAEEAVREEAAEAAIDSGAVVENLDALNWDGAWRSFWRGGQALLTIQQDGNTITGSYQPGDGEIEAQVEGIILRGVWRQPGNDGYFEFAMAPDGESFVGRYGNGEYWNGVRLTENGLTAALFGQETPQAAFASFVSAQNAAQEGDALAEILIRQYLTFAPSEDDDSLRSRNARIDALDPLVDLATFRLRDVPEANDGSEVTVPLGIAGTDFTFPLTIVKEGTDTWAVLVPTIEELNATRLAVLDATGAPTLDDLRADRRYSPRQAVQDFQRGALTWSNGGDQLLLDTLDLSEIPESLRATDGPIAAEYLRQVLTRLGHTVWQEIPNNPDRRHPLLIYENAGGTIEMDRYPQEDGSVRWLFTADSLKHVSGIFQDMQNLPIADGVKATKPLTNAFAMRSQMREISPRLLNRPFILENWQWLAIAATLVVAIVGAFLVSRLLRAIVRAVLNAQQAEPETRKIMDHLVGLPIILFLMGGVLTIAVRQLGLRQDISEIANVFASALAGDRRDLFLLLPRFGDLQLPRPIRPKHRNGNR